MHLRTRPGGAEFPIHESISENATGSDGLRPPVALAALDALQIDAVEQHGQVGGTHFDAVAVGRGRGEAKGAFFETLEAGIAMPPFLWR